MVVCLGSEAVPPGLVLLDSFSEQLVEIASFNACLTNAHGQSPLYVEFLGLCPLFLPNGFCLQGQLPS